jgi:hypothetical protein
LTGKGPLNSSPRAGKSFSGKKFQERRIHDASTESSSGQVGTRHDGKVPVDARINPTAT